MLGAWLSLDHPCLCFDSDLVIWVLPLPPQRVVGVTCVSKKRGPQMLALSKVMHLESLEIGRMLHFWGGGNNSTEPAGGPLSSLLLYKAFKLSRVSIRLQFQVCL